MGTKDSHPEDLLPRTPENKKKERRGNNHRVSFSSPETPYDEIFDTPAPDSTGTNITPDSDYSETHYYYAKTVVYRRRSSTPVGEALGNLSLSPGSNCNRSRSKSPNPRRNITSSKSDIEQVEANSPTPKGRNGSPADGVAKNDSACVQLEDDIVYSEEEKQYGKMLDQLFSLDFRQRLRNRPIKCISSTQSGKQCRNSSHHPESINSHSNGIYDHVMRFIESTHCRTHAKKAKPLLDQHRKMFEEIPTLQGDDYFGFEQHKHHQLSALIKWMNSLDMEQRVPPSGTKTAAAATSVVKAKYSSTEPYVFSKYIRKTKLHKSPIQQVQDRLKVFPSVKGKTSELGSIYILIDPFRPGYLKIGKTDRSSGDRTNEHRRDCKRYLEEYIPNSKSGKPDMGKAPHIAHVEKLIQAELDDFRLVADCKACPAEHNEWFKVHPEIAVKIVEKWMVWAREQSQAHGT